MINLIINFGILLIVCSLTYGRALLWQDGGALLLPSPHYTVPFALILIAAGVVANRFKFRFQPEMHCIGFLLFFFADWITADYQYLLNEITRGEIALFFILAIFGLQHLKGGSLVMPIVAATIAAYSFFHTADGRLLTSDDHAVFIYRLTLLNEQFPNIPFYYPYLNGGLDARDFFATGALNVFLFFLPLIKLFGVEPIYNIIVATLFFVITPLATYYAARTIKLENTTAAIAATLAISANLLWYRWGFKYGTLGFCLATALIPMNLALSHKLLINEISRADAIILALSMILMLMWSASGLVFIPAALLAVFTLPRWVNKRSISVALSIVLVTLPWVFIMLNVSEVGQFVSHGAVTETAINEHTARVKYGLELTGLQKALAEGVSKFNPVIIFLGLPGLWLLSGGARLLYLLTACWLLFLGVVGPPIKPQLELDRMLVILSIIGALPTAAAISYLSATKHVFIRALPIAFLLTGIATTSAILHNRSMERFTFMTPEISAITDTIHNHTGNGRTLFAGFILHELSGAHLAPLPIWTGKGIVASSPFNNVWRYKDVIPARFLAAGDSGIDSYLTLMNISLVIAHEPKWKEYFRIHKDRFTFINKIGNFESYTVNNFANSYLFEGAGEVAFDNSSLTIVLNTASAVLKFKYFDFLTTESCQLSPYPVTDKLSLIKLTNCPIGSPITIRSVSAFKRVLSKKAA